MTDQELKQLAREALECHGKADYARELDLWEKISQARPDHPMWKHNVAFALMNNGRFAEALELFDYLAKFHPDLSRVHNNRAVLLLRLGFEFQYLVPAFVLALETSRDAGEYSRHFHNLCMTIAYGTDSGAQSGFDALEKTFKRPLLRVTPKTLAAKNTAFFRKTISAFRKIAAYREAFARKQWTVAQQELESAREIFKQLELNNYAHMVDYSARCLTLCRETIGTLEQLTQDPSLTPEKVHDRFDALLGTARSLWKEGNESALNQLINILGWFLSGCKNVLSYLSDPTVPYKEDDESRNQIVRLSSEYFVEIGRDLIAFLEFAHRQSVTLSDRTKSIATPEIIRTQRDEAWKRLVLFAHGLTFNFANVDTTLANEILGWKTSAPDEARLEIQKFKLFVERQAHRDVFVDGKPQENIARSLLQAFLASRSYREVKVRGGNSDLLAFSKNGRFLYETKIWRGPDYYNQGLRELEEYIAGEGDDEELKGAFYIVFDPTRSQSAVDFLGGAMSKVTICNKGVDVVVVNLCPPQPSKKRSEPKRGHNL